MADLAFHPEAFKEYQAAVDWYQERNPAAAQRFVLEVEKVVTMIATQPDRFGWYLKPFREAGLVRFPYSIIYRADSAGDVLVLAVAHSSREPGYWKNRTE